MGWLENAEQLIATAFGVPRPIVKGMLKHSKHSNFQRTQLYDHLGKPLHTHQKSGPTKKMLKKKIVNKIKPEGKVITAKLHKSKERIVKTPNKILGNSMARRRFRKRRGFRKGRHFRRRRLSTLQPNSQAIVLKTNHYEDINPGAGGASLVVNTYALNGSYDPWLATDSVQPLGFDQWSALYRKYVVIGWKARIECVTLEQTSPIVIGFCPQTLSASLTSYLHYKECPGNKSIVLSGDKDHAEFWVRGGVEKYLYGSRKRGRMTSDDEVVALTSANPTRVLYGHLYAQPLNGSTDVSNIYVNITLYQTVLFFERIIPARS